MNIKHIASNCCKESDFEQMDMQLHKYNSANTILPFYGLHPWWLNERSENWLINLKQKILENPNN